ncbi:hypothetical protein DOY81_001924, partial [Sarcophaga bullata]
RKISLKGCREGENAIRDNANSPRETPLENEQKKTENRHTHNLFSLQNFPLIQGI